MGLFLGGLFVLGLLCGERAYAADGVAPDVRPAEAVRSVQGSAERAVTRSAERVTQGAEDAKKAKSARNSEGAEGAESAVSSPRATGLHGLDDALPAPAPAAKSQSGSRAEAPSHTGAVAPVGPVGSAGPEGFVHEATAPVTGGVQRVVRPAAERVVRPIGDVVDQVADGFAEPPASSWWPPESELPAFPSSPYLPGLPALPAFPGQTLPVGSTPQQPDGVAEEHGATGLDAGESPGDESTGVHGPQFTGGHTAPDAGVRDNDEGARGAQSFARPAPNGDSKGALGHGSATDNGSSRHGDAQAVTFNDRAQLRLVPGTAAAVTVAETRDRHRDIPVFPG
ncbi:hypothetical protein [Streptomyces sporangiiformans]|uniref:Uncharacterized protein n=1 Tax=Streptomyces sporangiiformans TaxID=2315329 RepID=A0A505DND8_9ACTN|nr:hypothetical protein [Streptomyces sporangiiformans]TPQ21841.1 hypothetical protein FGD71_013175 [Streptomyces sporangiiformans]